VIANVNDAIIFTGKITFRFDHLPVMTVDVRASGKGSTIVSTMNMSELDVGRLFTVEPTERRFVLHNRGRRAQELKWTQQKPVVEGETGAVFQLRVQPDSKVLHPDEKCEFVFRLGCIQPCTFSVTLVCSATLNQMKTYIFMTKVWAAA